MKYSLAFSPCPNDTFIFDALVNKKIDTAGFEFDVLLEDVQTLNQWAMQGKCQFSKISYGVLPLITNNYKVLNSGGALGIGVGPLLISNKQQQITNETIVAIPGENTTAHLLFSMVYPNHPNKKFMPFNEIEQWLLNNDNINSAGVIIHENRFTYLDKGLQLVANLGAVWEQQINVPIPLGGIVVHNAIDAGVALQVNQLIQKSIAYAWQQYPTLSTYVQQHAQEMSALVMQQHIDMYVNDYSTNLGVNGKAAVMQLLQVFAKQNKITLNPQQQFFID